MSKIPVIGALIALALPACSLATFTRSQAAQDFSCPENQLQMEEVADGAAITARGCGREAIYLRSSFRSPIERASFDLSCPATQLKMFYLHSDSIGVVGCGKRVSYAWVDGSWVGSSAH
jgi:hypothetical protein